MLRPPVQEHPRHPPLGEGRAGSQAGVAPTWAWKLTPTVEMPKERDCVSELHETKALGRASSPSEAGSTGPAQPSDGDNVLEALCVTENLQGQQSLAQGPNGGQGTSQALMLPDVHLGK